MSHAEVADLVGVVSVAVPHGHAEITDIAGVSGPSVAAEQGHAEITRITGVVVVPTGLQARAGNDFAVSSFTDVVLDGSISTGSWVSASWSRVSDSRVAPVAPFPTVLDPISPEPDTAPVVTIQFPAHPETYTVVLRLTVTDGVTVSSDTVTVTVWAWPFWRVAGLQLVPRVRYRLTAA